MPHNFLPCDREQLLLLPPCMLDWLEEGRLALFVLDTFEQMDLSAFYAEYRSDGWGAAAFESLMMVSLLLYAYRMGNTSSRKIEKACVENVAYHVIAANGRPDHSTPVRRRYPRLTTLALLEILLSGGLVMIMTA